MNNSCAEMIKNSCPDMFFFPNVPVLFNDIYLAYIKSNNLTNEKSDGLLYICSNKSHYDAFFNITTKVLFNNTTCFLYDTISYSWPQENLWSIYGDNSLRILSNQLQKYQMIYNYNSTICNRSLMYQCLNSSKCIPIHRLLDGIDDCPLLDDEKTLFERNDTDVIKQFEQSHYKCPTSKKWIHKSLLKDQSCNCGYNEYEECEDNNKNVINSKRDIFFRLVCDGFTELNGKIIHGQNHTDETECAYWECDNIYTHCDEIWNCANGKDEINCRSQSASNCSLNDHICVSPKTNQFICLPIEKANDGQIDCLGAYDEPQFCRTYWINNYLDNNFYCRNQTNSSCIRSEQLCNNQSDCQYGDDEQFCIKNRTSLIDNNICSPSNSQYLSDVEKFLCYQTQTQTKYIPRSFKIATMNILDTDRINNIENAIVSHSSPAISSAKYERYCLRGIDLYVWSDDKKIMTCLCPSSYYGSRCQYQNQRISLTIHVRALSQSYKTLFAIVISLIDDTDQRIIHSFIQISYFAVRDCAKKYTDYLVYSSRPKDPTKTYSIHIDIYEKKKLLIYRGSLLFPIQFPFLPVHRLAFIVDIPRKSANIYSCSNNPCYHGKCIRYSNIENETTFCQCQDGWIGRYCNIKLKCTCSSDSICIGISANNQSICVCPLNKFGSRCLLVDSTSTVNIKCQNDGQPPPSDYYTRFTSSLDSCICPVGFHGFRCESNDSKLILSFNREIIQSDSFFIHFIYVSFDISLQSTTFQTIPVQQDSVTIYETRQLHLVFIEFPNNNYYLVFNDRDGEPSVSIKKLVKASDRCPHVNELLNRTIAEYEPIRRIKYYQLPCQMYSPDLKCFYDEDHLCLCYNFSQKRLAHCFLWDHQTKFYCIGRDGGNGDSECENDGSCFQDNANCPLRSVCMCSPCYYGRRCQFNTNGFGASLDGILGYHIFPNVNIGNQPNIVKFSLSLTVIFLIIALIDGIICLITFKNKTICEVGCGLYLLSSSIITLLTTIVFELKFFILLLTQMQNTPNESFLLIQCRSIDFLLRICLSMDQWLNACVAVERTMVTIKGPNFGKEKSKKAAKFIIVILFIIISASYIHDPIYRRLLDENDDDNQKRTWCIVSYSSNVEVYIYIIYILHFFGPFSINLISSIILIIKVTLQQSKLQKKESHKKILKEQIQQHKHLLIAPIVLVLLSIPRLVITFVSKCMKSSGDAWLYLIGYFISIIPSMVNSIVFILPSEFYRKECHKTLLQYRTNIHRYLHLTR